jgi:hypothetical protein
MTLDFLDAAFVDRWQASLGTPIPVTPPVATIAAPAADDFVGRLLAAARTEWEALADEVVAARGRGRRAVAIVACERAAGCSTLVAGLVRVLHERRRDAIACASDAIPTTGATHDKRIVLVDAGVWFPPGRINRQRLMVASSAKIIRPRLADAATTDLPFSASKNVSTATDEARESDLS